MLSIYIYIYIYITILTFCSNDYNTFVFFFFFFEESSLPLFNKYLSFHKLGNSRSSPIDIVYMEERQQY